MRSLPLMAYLSVPMLGIGLTGCTVGPNFQAPEIAEAPRRTSTETAGLPSRTVEGKIDQTWWKSFRDPQLSALVERLASQNLDLKTAAERVLQSVAQRQVAVSRGLPHVEGQSLSTYNRVSQNGLISEFEPAPGATLDYALFRDGLTSSWQLDLFGRVRRAVEAADADTLAAVENRHGVALAALAEMTQTPSCRGERRSGQHAFRQRRRHHARSGAGPRAAGHHRRDAAAASDPGGRTHQRRRDTARRSAACAGR
jgi:hypothetical protein